MARCAAERVSRALVMPLLKVCVAKLILKLVLLYYAMLGPNLVLFYHTSIVTIEPRPSARITIGCQRQGARPFESAPSYWPKVAAAGAGDAAAGAAAGAAAAATVDAPSAGSAALGTAVKASRSTACPVLTSSSFVGTAASGGAVEEEQTPMIRMLVQESPIKLTAPSEELRKLKKKSSPSGTRYRGIVIHYEYAGRAD